MRTKNVRKGGAIGDIKEFWVSDVSSFKVGDHYTDCYEIINKSHDMAFRNSSDLDKYKLDQVIYDKGTGEKLVVVAKDYKAVRGQTNNISGKLTLKKFSGHLVCKQTAEPNTQ